jgi:hypothetical protein
MWKTVLQEASVPNHAGPSIGLIVTWLPPKQMMRQRQKGRECAQRWKSVYYNLILKI